MARITRGIGIAPCYLAASFWFTVACLARPCGASDIGLAAESYDAALAHYNRAEYAESARLYLEADTLYPSKEALTNAIAAARQANDHLLVVRAALRAQAREATAPELAAQARQALVEAEKHLSRMDLGCLPMPCRLSIDGTHAEPGRHYLIPGSHTFGAEAQGRSISQQLLTHAGATYHINLQVLDDAVPSHSKPSGQSSSAATLKANSQPGGLPEDPAISEQPSLLPVEVFYASLAATGIATGVTVWSGLDALEKKRELADPPSESSREDLLTSVRRTDILLAGSAVLALVTTYVGWRLVDFGESSFSAHAAPDQARLSVSGSF